jgi:hypothetical protein
VGAVAGIMIRRHQSLIRQVNERRPVFSQGSRDPRRLELWQGGDQSFETRTPRVQINAGQFDVPRSFLVTVVAYARGACFKIKGDL